MQKALTFILNLIWISLAVASIVYYCQYTPENRFWNVLLVAFNALNGVVVITMIGSLIGTLKAQHRYNKAMKELEDE